MAKYRVRLAIRALIEFVLRHGDITTTSIGGPKAVEGIRAHQRFQKAQGDDYQAEVRVEHEVIIDDMVFYLHGRIDGVFEDEQGIVLDEIKSVGVSLDKVEGMNPLHWAQVKMYGYIYCLKNKLEGVHTRLTYIELEDYQAKHFRNYYTQEDLEIFYFDILNQYIRWARTTESFKERSKESLQMMHFPFENYRLGQKSFMSSVYKTIEEGQVLFSRAPTGIGKTIASLFPALKAYGRSMTEKIFYLTAKTIGKEVAADSLKQLEEQGIHLKRVIITAKDKICLNEETKCNPEDCPYAKGHFDRVNHVIELVFNQCDTFDRETIERYSKEHCVCPYELSLDLALFSDVIICDYNYVFDPQAMLRRFFVEGGGRYTLLIDEAHNLVDRARSMYSASLSKEQVLRTKNLVKGIDEKLHQYLSLLNKQLITCRKMCEEQDEARYEEKDMPHLMTELIRSILHRIEKVISQNREWIYTESLLEFYFEVYDFVKKAEYYSEKYVTYYEKKEQEVLVTLYCLDPSDNIKHCVEGMQGCIYFSATLLPMPYFIKLLGGNDNSYGLVLPSPFEPKRLKLLIDRSISTKFYQRDRALIPIAERINAVVRGRKGNYMVFFPSYKFLEDVLDVYMTQFQNHGEVEVIYQERNLSEQLKETFLAHFHRERDNSLVAFSVLGGMFSEGIDLTGERLIGVIIVGVGLPQICYERDLLRDYFAASYHAGFEYAYVYPGMNKVLQAAGRVIRTITDKGVVILLDERFQMPMYRQLFPQEWDHVQTVSQLAHLEEEIEYFWSDKNGE